MVEKPRGYIHYEKGPRGYWGDPLPGKLVIGRLAVDMEVVKTLLWGLVAVTVVLLMFAPLLGLWAVVPILVLLGLGAVGFVVWGLGALVRYVKSGIEWRGPGA